MAPSMIGAGFYDFKVNDINGKTIALKEYKGKVLLIVNTASKCGLTPQYAGLQELYAQNKDKGLVVLGFPANDFREQEPGTNEQIRDFCQMNYEVTFPMFEKISVKGEKAHPLYKWLIENGPRQDEIEWNFAKFVVSREGKVVGRFAPKTAPNDEAFVAFIKGELSRKFL